MRFNVLVIVLFVVAGVVSALVIPTTTSGLAVRKRVDEPPDWWRSCRDEDVFEVSIRGRGVYNIHREKTMQLNSQVYYAEFKTDHSPVMAIKYDESAHISRFSQSPYGEAAIGTKTKEGTTWYLRHPPSKDLEFFTRTPAYKRLVAMREHDEGEFNKEVLKLTIRAAELAVKRVGELGAPCWRRMGEVRLNDFMFNFGRENPRAEVLMVPMTIQGQNGPRIIPADLEQRLLNLFQGDWKADPEGGAHRSHAHPMGGVAPHHHTSP